MSNVVYDCVGNKIYEIASCCYHSTYNYIETHIQFVSFKKSMLKKENSTLIITISLLNSLTRNCVDF